MFQFLIVIVISGSQKTAILIFGIFLEKRSQLGMTIKGSQTAFGTQSYMTR